MSLYDLFELINDSIIPDNFTKTPRMKRILFEIPSCNPIITWFTKIRNPRSQIMFITNEPCFKTINSAALQKSVVHTLLYRVYFQ